MKEKHCFLVTVNDGAYVVHQSAHSTHERAVAALARWCREEWEEQDHTDWLDNGICDTSNDNGPRHGDTDAMAVDRYFSFWEPEQRYLIEELTIDADEDEAATPSTTDQGELP